MDPQTDYGWNTILAHFGEEQTVLGAVVPPIFQNSLFLFESIDDLSRGFAHGPEGPPYVYSRVGNPNVQLAEKKIAKLEGTDGCRLFGSGMAALTTAVMSCIHAGSHVVMIDTVYGPLRHFVQEYLKRFEVSYTLVTGTCTDEVVGALRLETSLVVLESPSSLLFRIQDVPAIAKVCRERGISTMIDNTYCTPLYFQPASLGVDLVCHSATKYLGGHSDVVAGAVCADKERIQSISNNEVSLFGGILHPFSAWLLTRGLRTLGVRIKQHEATANALASWLEVRPEIARVHHVALPSHPQHELFRTLMKGSTGLFSFEPKVQDPEKVKAFCDRLKLFGKGISWGGFESLAVAMAIQPMDYADRRWIVRLHCGLEEPADLIADLEQALVEIA